MNTIRAIISIMRLDKPVGILLLWWPVACALWMSQNEKLPQSNMWLSQNWIVFALGTILMRSAGCVINDILDRQFDSKVTRTQQRPLAQGTLNLKQALTVFAVLMLLASTLLYWLNPLARGLALLAAVMTTLYPLCKRYTYLAQLFLGLTFNMGVLMAFAQVQNRIPMEAILLYGSAICWTLAYDTTYALQDARDDAALGLKSTALLFQQHTLPVLCVFYALAWALFYAAGAVNPLLMGLSGLCILIALYQTSRKQYHSAFQMNILVGWVWFLAI